MLKKVSMGITEFALPVPRRGSIDAYSGLGRSQQQLGQEIHLKVQSRRKAEHPEYQSEVSLSHEFDEGAYRFEVRGRMDGFFPGSTPKIEEIKSSFNVYALLHHLKESGDHPYCLQLRTYGYLYWLKNGVIPALNLHLVSTRNGQALDLELELDANGYEEWLKSRLAELVEEARQDEKRIKRRAKAAEALVFPFERPRRGQAELIQTIEEGMEEGKSMLLQAPTGLGKTMGVLYPVLKEALSRGQKVIYATPKNSQHFAAEDALGRLQERGPHLKSLTLTAKKKLCLKEEPHCDPEYCEYAKDHYSKLAEHGVVQELLKKRSLTAKTFRKIAQSHQVCPFEIQFEALREADLVVCDYNYVFSPRAAPGKLTANGLLKTGKPNLIVDEAHNLPARAQEYYSATLSTAALRQFQKETQNLPGQFKLEARNLIDQCIQLIEAERGDELEKSHPVAPKLNRFLSLDQELKAFLSSYLASDAEIHAGNPVMNLYFYWSSFVAALEYALGDPEKFFTLFSPHPPALRITCCDASDALNESYSEYAQRVAFSATLKPFEFYSRLMGLEPKKLKTAEFASPFPASNRKIIVIPQLSSKFSDRERNYPKIAEALSRIGALRRGNYIAFFPSFSFLERVLERFEAPAGFAVLRQERSMTKEGIESILESLRDPEAANFLFAVQGGVFSEGVDYPGSMVIGAFVVGTPLPNFDLEREKMREYYEKHYASGFDYAYAYPAMAKAVQAAGRVIRSETDRGIIVLMDGRFIQKSYAQSMPQDWFDLDPRELTSQSILKEISDFWSNDL